MIGRAITNNKMKNEDTQLMNALPNRRMGFYEKYIKRFLDFVCCVLAIAGFWWLYLAIAITVKIKLGSPVIFKQPRPGLVGKDGKERIFVMYKFRTMSNEKGEDGQLLPDEKRLTAFGQMLRNTSLDELPEIFNILKGDMSIIGPRPQLVKDLVFMSDQQRMRHTAKPGLSGLAQVNGRNAITWEKKLEWDLRYIENIRFRTDLGLVFKTFAKVFGRGEERETQQERKLTYDYGYELLQNGYISEELYKEKQQHAKTILEKTGV